LTAVILLRIRRSAAFERLCGVSDVADGAQ
jgi:hypothetical protein